jgi:hypothetical protein
MPNPDYLQPVPDQSIQDIEVVQPELAFDDLPSSMWGAPGSVQGELRQLHASLVDSLRRDARHLPTGVVAAMQLERVAFYYIKIRSHETAGDWPNPRYREHLYKLWRDTANDLAAGAHSTKISPDALHQVVSQHTAKIVASVLSTMPREDAKPLYKRFAQALEEGDSANA